MRLDEEVLMDFFREHTSVTVSIITAGSFVLFTATTPLINNIMWQYEYWKAFSARVGCIHFVVQYIF